MKNYLTFIFFTLTFFCEAQNITFEFENFGDITKNPIVLVRKFTDYYGHIKIDTVSVKNQNSIEFDRKFYIYLELLFLRDHHFIGQVNYLLSDLKNFKAVRNIKNEMNFYTSDEIAKKFNHFEKQFLDDTRYFLSKKKKSINQNERDILKLENKILDKYFKIMKKSQNIDFINLGFVTVNALNNYEPDENLKKRIKKEYNFYKEIYNEENLYLAKSSNYL